jgi:hypothetical protein
LIVALGLLCWFAVSFAMAPLIGMAMRHCDRFEREMSPAVLRAKAQHPARHAA